MLILRSDAAAEGYCDRIALPIALYVKLNAFLNMRTESREKNLDFPHRRNIISQSYRQNGVKYYAENVN